MNQVQEKLEIRSTCQNRERIPQISLFIIFRTWEEESGRNTTRNSLKTFVGYWSDVALWIERTLKQFQLIEDKPFSIKSMSCTTDCEKVNVFNIHLNCSLLTLGLKPCFIFSG